MDTSNRTPDYVTELHQHYAEVANQPSALLSVDQRRGVEFYLADIGETEQPATVIRNWIAFVHDLDRFVSAIGRLPRSDSRRPRARTEEQALVDRLAYQRRPEVRAAHCSYQTLRLESFPSFRWEPQEERWAEQLMLHQSFWAETGRAPRRDAPDPKERAIARWATHQRAAQRNGTLTPDRARRLRHATYRIL
ncbi:hypothetical protein DEJ16_03630 [Curtobacterium sp. MCJR17_055]|uniref:helicase associated domain-containing protein n=1 Tax=unclassified Curtobacterium TaxID=257496 RepID=UPI000D8B72D1|nr:MULTISPECIES: helicase associated domain-containing protein [unclassified Curtobacterium]PYY33769.1 hypothetical protein DEI87_10930 [Curtobacterium sp. MCBD17_029]PYY58761.1 hypothetical protein DEJ16_03630 [Curtobacterium sp. MCJR17_055]PYY59698.1 hypothetical protein DEJ26_07275 [Curtobacterium sp. MCPF17_015]